MASQHILVLRFSALGDVAMCVPVLRCLSKAYPELRLTVVTRKRFAPLFEELPNVAVFTPDFKGIHKGIRGLFRLYKTLLKLQPTAIADVHNVLRTKIVRAYFAPRFWIQKAALDKGRKTKKVYPLLREDGSVESYSSDKNYSYINERIEKGDAHYTKFLEPKKRAAPAHH